MKYKIFGLMMLLLIFLGGCVPGINFKTTDIQAIEINGDDFIEVGQTKLLDIKTDPAEKDVKVMFVSSDDDVITIDENGYIQGVSVGSATITATLKDNEEITDSLVINVNEAVLEDLTIIGQTKLFLDSTITLDVMANPYYASQEVTWKSSDPEIAMVNSEGIVTGLFVGEVEITATSLSDPTKVAKINLTIIPGIAYDFEIQAPTSIVVGKSSKINIISGQIDISSHFTWGSSDQQIALVDSFGVINGLKHGFVTITITNKYNLEVVDSFEIYVSEEKIEDFTIQGATNVYINSTTQLTIGENATISSKDVTWESSNLAIATVDENGVVSGLSAGVVEIIATSIVDPTKKAKATITVDFGTPSEFEVHGPDAVYYGETVNYYITSGLFNITNHFTWDSSNQEIASVDSFGTVTTYKSGEVTITVTSIYDSKISQSFVLTVEDLVYKKTRVLSIIRSNYYIELFGVDATKITQDTKILKYDGSNVNEGSLNDLYVGMENIYVGYIKETGIISSILIDGNPGYSNIRVGIRKSISDISDESTLFHDSIDLTIKNSSTIQTFDGTKSVNISGDSNVFIKYQNGRILVSSNGNLVLDTIKRIIIIPNNTNEAITINSITRGSNKVYSGNMEVSIYSNRLIMVNDINLEKYLYKVVPSEMPASYSMEALKAQAIAARTYAYKDILNKTYEEYGYTVDDSVKSQVYNNINQQARTTTAVDQTRGLIMMSNGELVNAFYYSTSAGITASAHEVWISDENTNPDITPYLIGQNLTKDYNGNTIEFDYTNETDMLEFFKMIDVDTPDNNIRFHRWKVDFTKSQLTETLSKNLKLRYAATPNLVLTKVGSEYKSLPISEEIGAVERIYVGKRGTSGVVVELIIETTTNTYKIINQYNIRFAIRPSEIGKSVDTATAGSGRYTGTYSSSILLSGFFAIEESNGVFTFYGGGNGHGVGMSQNGANSLGNSGVNYQDILRTYYSNMELIDITYNYKELDDYKSLLKK